MKTTLYIIALTLLTLSCNSQTADTENYKRVDNATWAVELAKADATPQIIDVRTPGEFEAGNIEGSVNIDYLNDDFLNKMEDKVAKDETVYLYCKSGGRSAKASQLLISNGYSRIIELRNGYSGYNQK